MEVRDLAGLDAVAALSTLATRSSLDQSDLRQIAGQLSRDARITVVMSALDDEGLPWVVAGATPDAEEFAARQFAIDEGPCKDAAEQQLPVWARTASAQRRWPRWGPQLIDEGIDAVVSIPVVDEGRHLGSVWVALTSPDDIDDGELGFASSMAMAAVRCVARQRENARLREKVAQLERALESRVRIEQAKGLLAARWECGLDHAFERLRRYARSHHLRLRDVATRVVLEGFVPEDEPAEVSELLPPALN